MSSNGEIIRVRRYFEMNRRDMLRGAAAVGAAGMLGLGGMGKARAATDINFVGWEGYDSFLVGGGFDEAKGYTFQKTLISSTDEIITKLRLDSSAVDVCTPYFVNDDFLAEEGLLAPLDLAQIPNFEKIHPTIKQYAESNMSQDGTWYACPFTYGSLCMVYDSKEIPAPTSWADLMKPEYKGKAAITADYQGNIFAMARVLGIANPHRMTRDELAKTTELMIDLKKNHLKAIAPSYGDLINMYVNKEIVISQGWEPLSAWIGDGETVKIAYPKEGSFGFIEGYGIGKGSSKSADAYALIDNALSLQGQLAGADLNSMPVVTAEAMEKAGPASKAIYDYNDLEGYFNGKTLIMQMYPLDEEGDLAIWDDYQEAWEKVLKA
ncbi:extracellular solute-binding protein [Zavarzinia compransoris]|uniref:ABC transporter substrate-binding protein n=1 Tax=Zavarzinia marina TaxID=2911065 RepID=UPI001F3F2834|nr:extracellular solute-binding protein [Zavarzinia marina]MCF4165327.1 extracellular solute-binding protein [Zavarzinia marina]